MSELDFETIEYLMAKEDCTFEEAKADLALLVASWEAMDARIPVAV
tara:strand:- start:44 stop:181 length:138 start_codon:yes stop_codon:yes gene_type:complete